MRKALYILGDLTETDIAWLANAGKVEQLETKQTLIKSGEAVLSLYIVLEGKLAVLLNDGSEIASLGAGDIVGEMSLIEKRPPEVNIHIVEKTRILSIPLPVIQEKLSGDVNFAARFYRALAVFLSDRLRETTAKISHVQNLTQDSSQIKSVGTDMELDEGILDNLHVAGNRMRYLLAILEGIEK